MTFQRVYIVPLSPPLSLPLSSLALLPITSLGFISLPSCLQPVPSQPPPPTASPHMCHVHLRHRGEHQPMLHTTTTTTTTALRVCPMRGKRNQSQGCAEQFNVERPQRVKRCGIVSSPLSLRSLPSSERLRNQRESQLGRFVTEVGKKKIHSATLHLTQCEK